MLGEQNDSTATRYQLLVIVIATAGILAWSYFFMPPQEPQQAPDVEEITLNGEGANTGELAAAVPAPEQPAAAVETPPAPAAEPPSAAPAVPPPLPADPALDEQTVTLSTGRLKLEFTPVGARLKRAWVLVGETEEEHPQLVPEDPALPGDRPLYPLGLFGLRPVEGWRGDELDFAAWTPSVDEANRRVAFTYTQDGVVRVTKTFTLDPDEYFLDVTVDYENLSGAPQRLGLDAHIPAYTFNWVPALHSDDEDMTRGSTTEIIWRKGGQSSHHAVSSLEPPSDATGYSEYVPQPDWISIKSTYFLVAMRIMAAPEDEWVKNAWAWVAGDPLAYRFGVAVPRSEIAPGGRETRNFRLYMGPTHLASLKTAAANGFPELGEALQFFTSVSFMDWFAKMLLSLLNFFHDNVYANYGIAIILLTIVVRIVVFPLTLKSMKSMKKMQLLAPEIEKIKAEVGADNPQELQKRTMEMYRSYGVNPLGGCFPMLLQMPVFFALYRMLWYAFELRGAPFLWIADLSREDALYTLPVSVNIIFTTINAINILPFLMAIAMVASQKLMPTSGPMQTPQQKFLMNFMPVFFSIICYNMSAGLNLYILTSTLLGIGQNYVMNLHKIELTQQELKKTTARKPRHFYNAAQARKKQMAKEMRRAKQERSRGEPVAKREPKQRS